MSRPARLRPGQADPLSDQFAADYAAGGSFSNIGARYSVDHQRVARALRRRPGFVQRNPSESCVLPHKPSFDRIAARAREQFEMLRPTPTFTPSVAAAGVSVSIRRMRARVRVLGPLCVDNRGTWQPQIEGSKTGRELPGIVDQVITMQLVAFEEGEPATRCLVCQQPNDWNYPAKDRSGRLDVFEKPDLGELIAKITAPAAMTRAA